MLPGVVLLSFGYLGEVNPVAHPIRKIWQLLKTPLGWTDFDPVMGTTHELVKYKGLNPSFFLAVFCCGLINYPPLVPKFMRAPLSR